MNGLMNGDTDGRIVIENVSKFYGEVLGINKVNLTIPPGITGLVGPNGSGKTTLMNLMVGLIRPTRGEMPRTTMRPLSGWIRPVARFISVVLPEPFGPTRLVMPGGMFSVTRFTPSTSP